MPGPDEEVPQQGPTWLRATDPRMIRVRRGDGQEFDLPADTAVSLGAPLELARPAPAAAPPRAPIMDMLGGAGAGAAPAAPAQPSPPPASSTRPARPPTTGEAAPAAPPPGLRRGETVRAAPPAPTPGASPAGPAPVLPEGFAAQIGLIPGEASPAVDPAAERQARVLSMLTGGEQVIPPRAPAAPGETAAPARLTSLRRRAAEPPREPTEEERNAALVDQLTARPQGDAPLVAADFRTSSPLEAEQVRIDEGRQLVQRQAHSEAVAAAERQDVLEEAARQQAELERQRQAAMAEATRRYNAAVEEARSARVDPSRFYRDRGAAGTIGVAIATALGGLGAALTGGPNRALETIERAIDRDIAAQEANQRNAQAQVGHARTFLEITRGQFQDREAAILAARALAWDQVAQRADQMAAQLRDEGAALRARELSAEATARAQAAQQEALIAAQDRELTRARAEAEIRRLNAQAARDERRAGGGGGAGRRGPSPMSVPAAVMGTEQDPAYQLALERGMTPELARLMLADDRGGARSPRNRLLSQLLEGEGEQRFLPGNVVPIDPRNPPRLTVNDRNTINAMNRVELALTAAERAYERHYRTLQGLGLIGTAARTLWDRLPGAQQSEATLAIREMNAIAAGLRSNIRRVLDESSTQAVSDELHEAVPEIGLSGLNLEQARGAFRANLAAKRREANAALEGIGYRFTEGAHGGGGGGGAPLPGGVRPRDGGDEDDED